MAGNGRGTPGPEPRAADSGRTREDIPSMARPLATSRH